MIATHVFTTGPSQNFLEFCVVNEIKKVMFIGHPLMYQKDQKGSGWQLYKEGKLIKEDYTTNKKRMEVIDYLRHAFLNVWWALKSKEKWDIYVGSDNLNAFCGIILKWLGKVNKVVYYTIDFVPQRFDNNLLNKIYHWIDIFCVKNCDITWNLSPRMVEGREKYSKLDKKYRKKQVLVPEGVWFNRIERLPFEKINQHHSVFLGHLMPRLGVQKVIQAIPKIIQSIPDFKFIIIGKGDYRQNLEALAHNLDVEKYIDFKGFIPEHKDVEGIISKCAIGIACYSDEEENFAYYCDPSKTKIYMGCGLPVIMTNIFYNAQEIEDAGAGKIVQYNASEIAKAVVEMMSDRERLRQYKEAASVYIKNLDWNILFHKRLEELLWKKPI